MADALALTAHLPTLELADGAALTTEGGAAGSIWILESGALVVRKGDVEVNRITHAGSIVGEMSLLLGRPHSATVVAAGHTVVRHAADGQALLNSDPEFTTLVATGLADRLAFVTTYLADLTHQYGDAPGLSMVSGVLTELAQRRAPRAVPGSAREPDPEY